MATEELPLSLITAIIDFVSEHEELYDPLAVEEMCFEVSDAFVQHVADNEVPVLVRTISGIRIEGGFVVGGGHAAVQYRDLVLDFTFRQIDPHGPVPRIVPVSVFRESWPELVAQQTR